MIATTLSAYQFNNLTRRRFYQSRPSITENISATKTAGKPRQRRVNRKLCITTLILKTMGFFSVPSWPEAKALGLVFSATYPWGSPAPFPLEAGFPPLIRYETGNPPRRGGTERSKASTKKRRRPSLRAGGSKSRRPPVTSKNSIVFLWMTKIVRFCKDLKP